MMNNLCDKCFAPSFNRLLNAFGALLCEDCWDEYISTPEGKVEYLIGIAKAEYPATEFDEGFLRFAAIQWQKNRSQLDMSDEEIADIENKLKQIKIL